MILLYSMDLAERLAYHTMDMAYSDSASGKWLLKPWEDFWKNDIPGIARRYYDMYLCYSNALH